MPVLEEITVNCAAVAGDSAVDTSTAESYDLHEKRQKDLKDRRAAKKAAEKAKAEVKGETKSETRGEAKTETKSRSKGKVKAEMKTRDKGEEQPKEQPKEKDAKSRPKNHREKQEGKPKRKQEATGSESTAKAATDKKRKGKATQKPRTKPIVSVLNANAPAFCPWNLTPKEPQRLPEEDKDVDWEKDFRRVNFTRRYSVCEERPNPNATEATRNATKETANTRRHRNINRNNVQQGDVSAMEQLIRDLELDQSQLLSIRISRGKERPTGRHADHAG